MDSKIVSGDNLKMIECIVPVKTNLKNGRFEDVRIIPKMWTHL